jgi:hypothetical protein
MCVFRIERPQQRPGEAFEKANHSALRMAAAGPYRPELRSSSEALDMARLRL